MIVSEPFFLSGCLQGPSFAKKTPQIKEIRRVPGLSLRVSIETNYLKFTLHCRGSWAPYSRIPNGWKGVSECWRCCAREGWVGAVRWILGGFFLGGMSLLQDPLIFHFCDIWIHLEKRDSQPKEGSNKKQFPKRKIGAFPLKNACFFKGLSLADLRIFFFWIRWSMDFLRHFFRTNYSLKNEQKFFKNHKWCLEDKPFF